MVSSRTLKRRQGGICRRRSRATRWPRSTWQRSTNKAWVWPRVRDQAEEWYRRAAEQGDPHAQLNLCRFIEIVEPSRTDIDEKGRITIEIDLNELPPLDRELLNWCKAAADRGEADAQFTMGMYFAMGSFIPNPWQAAQWFSLAAEQGHAEAQLRLGAAHSLGLGVDRDPVQAYVWFRLSADLGNVKARGEVEKFQRILSRKQLRKGERRLARWLERH